MPLLHRRRFENDLPRCKAAPEYWKTSACGRWFFYPRKAAFVKMGGLFKQKRRLIRHNSGSFQSIVSLTAC